MIANANLVTRNILEELEKSKFQFFLTGSRFFGGATAASDTDFFVQDSEEVRHFLSHILQMRKVNTRDHNYHDTHCNTVYREGKIDVQCVKNAELKSRVQERFREKGILKPSVELWDFGYLLLE